MFSSFKFFLGGIMILFVLQSARAQYTDSTIISDSSFLFRDSRDGKEYRAIRINGHIWMAENLRFNAKDSRCYNNSKKACKTYGRLYTWDEAVNACPKGWHLPSRVEWQQLVDYCGGDKLAGKPLVYSHYLDFNLVFGYPPNINGRFSTEDSQTHFWTSNANNEGTAFVYYFIRDKLPLVYVNYFSKNYGMMCRCVKDEESVNGN